MIPDSLQQLLDGVDGQQTSHWQGRDLVLFNAPWGELIVSLQGAQVLHFRPPNDLGWLWVTPTPQPMPGAIRGGIPLCWPWFADERYADETPDRSGTFHGLARHADWRLEAADEHAEGIELHLSPTQPLHSQLTVRAVVQANAQRLAVELITENVGESPVKVSGALHSYLAVDDAHQCRLEGLTGARYLDKLRDFAESEQQGILAIRGAVDRIYHSNEAVMLHDGPRTLRIGKQSSDSTVVWHPDQQPPADTSIEAAKRFVCVEAANTRLDPVWLVPGAQHLLGTTLSRS
ncbi:MULTISPECIES: D-hexose-6-phosphate mutarotase [Halomonadaceae]|jgi:glucose-6-phosphate 1-epimerase|uniref:D-hexose-6-phosphate mutarotase n=1 Tax=Halomonadaceae TaxID=28256 RepID=UPI0018EF676E|nr:MULTISPECIES: D-hexose-6-phosphate mutarotase [Halomonas]MCW4153621.1 D-hexose-6-phosphate mutarotase [Halomonas sp. 18H]MDR5886875.1 D-hexose-6-phosphate mutarotase [Halomonas janggokensis]QPL47352.1 D-hexose-6-phosphate mutarotase [Halomonas sp. A40-4]